MVKNISLITCKVVRKVKYFKFQYEINIKSTFTLLAQHSLVRQRLALVIALTKQMKIKL